MNATVITTGPGVIIDTATASMNCRSVSQWNCRTTPLYRNGTIASPLPNTRIAFLAGESIDYNKCINAEFSRQGPAGNQQRGGGMREQLEWHAGSLGRLDGRWVLGVSSVVTALMLMVAACSQGRGAGRRAYAADSATPKQPERQAPGPFAPIDWSRVG